MEYGANIIINTVTNLKSIFILLLVSLLSGCATQSATIPKSWAYTGDDAVTVVVSVGVATSGNYKSMLPYHSFLVESESNSDLLQLKADNDPGFRSSVGDYETTEGKFGIVKLVLKPGKYKITNIASYSPSPYGGVDLRANEKFSIPINLEPNKNYYLGNFTAHNISAKGGFGTTIVVGAFWVANTEEEPNFLAITKKYPELNNVKLENYNGKFKYHPYFFSSMKEAEVLFK